MSATDIARTLVRALALRDGVMAQHSMRVAGLSAAIGELLGLDRERCEALELAGLVHDVGKIAFPDRLVEGQNFVEDDWAIIRAHPAEGARLVRHLPGSLASSADVVLQHHERLDGSGYPHGLSGAQICESARILAVADSFDAMTDAGRRWCTAHTAASAMAELNTLAPRLYDLAAVEALESIVGASSPAIVPFFAH